MPRIAFGMTAKKRSTDPISGQSAWTESYVTELVLEG